MTDEERRLYIRLNQTLAKVIADIEGFQYNTAIAAQMELLNELYAFTARDSAVFGFALGRLVFMLAPFAPHLAEELWHRARADAGSLFRERFPDPDPAFLVFDEMEIPVQVNGRLRDKVVVPRSASDESVKQAALEAAGVRQVLSGLSVARVIYVKGRLVNIVTGR
jgi:leucyl-tRNA synthetase